METESAWNAKIVAITNSERLLRIAEGIIRKIPDGTPSPKKLHLNLNELVASHEMANNAVINVGHETELEIKQCSKAYTKLAKQLKDIEENTQ